jgi:hypothetical protein
VRPISQHDEQLFRTVFVATRLGRADAIVERLAARYAAEWDDPEAGFPYALAMMAALNADGKRARATDADGQLGYLQLIETLDDVLYNVPDHWLGRYSRVMIRALLPGSGVPYQQYVDEERAKLVADLAELMDRQARAHWQPYFACTYLLAARVSHEDDKDEARTVELVNAAADKPARPIPFPTLGAFLARPFLVVYSTPDFPARACVATMMTALFPGLPAVRAAANAEHVG